MTAMAYGLSQEEAMKRAEPLLIYDNFRRYVSISSVILVFEIDNEPDVGVKSPNICQILI
jgi:hypothetical protein